MWHFGRQHQRHFHQACYFAIPEPGFLIDELANAFLFNSIGVRLAGFQHLADDDVAMLGMEIEQVLADQLFTAIGSKGFDRFVIHLGDDAIKVANCDCDAIFLDPLVHLEFLEQIGSHDSTLNLVGSLINLQDLGIAHHLLYRIFFHIAISTQDLNGISGHFHGNV